MNYMKDIINKRFLIITSVSVEMAVSGSELSFKNNGHFSSSHVSLYPKIIIIS